MPVGSAHPPRPAEFPAGGPASPPGHGRARSRGRIAAAVVAGVLAFLGAGTAVSGGALVAIFGADGVARSDRHTLASPTAALVSRTTEIDGLAGAADVVGDPHIRISAAPAGDRPVFAGIARAADVERYLSGVAIDELTHLELQPFGVRRHRRAGAASAAAPGEQGFWVARATSAPGGRAELDWRLRDGDYRFVVMNADGTSGVRTATRVGLAVAHVGAVGAGLAVAGVLLLLAGFGGLGLALRRR